MRAWEGLKNGYFSLPLASRALSHSTLTPAGLVFGQEYQPPLL